MWRYSGAMRLPSDVSPVSLGEGDTPLVPWQPAPPAGARWLKVESASPTGSFKDRGAAVLAAVARALGVSRIVCDSSGNMAASISAYAAAAGLACEVFVPAGTSPAKLAQARAYGATITEVAGDRELVALTAQRALDDAFYGSHYWNPFFLEGTKTVAYEIVEALGGSVPDHVVVPVGHGTLWLGLLLGFEELAAAGITSALPRLHAVQAYGYAPIATAIRTDGASHDSEYPSESADEPPPVATLAEGIRITAPPRLSAIVAGLRRTDGCAVIVDDPSIEAARTMCARSGVWVEPTAAVAVAGEARLRALGVIGHEDTVVVTVTGHGLKSPGAQA